MFPPLSTLQIETTVWILPVRDLENAPHQGLTPHHQPLLPSPSLQEYIRACYQDTVREVWGKLKAPPCLIVNLFNSILALCSKAFDDTFRCSIPTPESMLGGFKIAVIHS